ncbi:hypothetical protein [Paraconexibacter sp. AEG42_29]|uniref:hypothetical protein n=1 Tax=Paraconexibacter sp. AEG42_29 TaxID=2997339 RepID=UPI00339D95CC
MLWALAAAALLVGGWRLAVAVHVTTSPGPCGLPPNVSGVCPDVLVYEHPREHQLLLVLQGFSALLGGVVLATLAARRAGPRTRAGRTLAAATVAVAVAGTLAPFAQPGLTDRGSRAVYDMRD